MTSIEDQFQKQEEKRVETERLRKYGPAKTPIKRKIEEGKLTLETLQRLESQVLEKTLTEAVEELNTHYMEMTNQIQQFSTEAVQHSINDLKLHREESDIALTVSLTKISDQLLSLVNLFTKYVADNQRAVDNINKYLADWT